jgi:hypothetical protein
MLLVPAYKEDGPPLIEQRVPSKFEIAEEDFALVSRYNSAVKDDRVLLLAHGGSARQIGQFRDCISDSDKYFAKHSARTYKNMGVMVGRVIDYFGLRTEELDRIRALEEDDIVHFRQMSVDKVHAEEIQQRVDRVLFAKSPQGRKEAAQVWKEVEQMELDLSEKAQVVTRMMDERGLSNQQVYRDELVIEHLAEHYYLPTVYSKGRRVDYIRHIIDTESEVRFLAALRDYVKKPDCILRDLDWWMFSKLDQYLDDPYIPYYDPKQNRMARFIPDFIFWGQKGQDYTILFVDPKGMEQIDWERKVDGFRRQFEDPRGTVKVFGYEKLTVTVRLALFTRDRNVCPEGGYKRFWQDNARDLFGAVF